MASIFMRISVSFFCLEYRIEFIDEFIGVNTGSHFVFTVGILLKVRISLQHLALNLHDNIAARELADRLVEYADRCKWIVEGNDIAGLKPDA